MYMASNILSERRCQLNRRICASARSLTLKIRGIGQAQPFPMKPLRSCALPSIVQDIRDGYSYFVPLAVVSNR